MASLIRSSCCTRAPTYSAAAGTLARSDSTTELRPGDELGRVPGTARRARGRSDRAGGRAGRGEPDEAGPVIAGAGRGTPRRARTRPRARRWAG